MSFSKAETVEHHDPEYNLRIIISIPLRVFFKNNSDIWTSELATSNLLIEQKSSKHNAYSRLNYLHRVKKPSVWVAALVIITYEPHSDQMKRTF